MKSNDKDSEGDKKNIPLLHGITLGASVNHQLLLLHRNNQIVSPKKNNNEITRENALYLLPAFLFRVSSKVKQNFSFCAAERGTGNTNSSAGHQHLLFEHINHARILSAG